MEIIDKQSPIIGGGLTATTTMNTATDTATATIVLGPDDGWARGIEGARDFYYCRSIVLVSGFFSFLFFGVFLFMMSHHHEQS